MLESRAKGSMSTGVTVSLDPTNIVRTEGQIRLISQSRKLFVPEKSSSHDIRFFSSVGSKNVDSEHPNYCMFDGFVISF